MWLPVKLMPGWQETLHLCNLPHLGANQSIGSFLCDNHLWGGAGHGEREREDPTRGSGSTEGHPWDSRVFKVQRRSYGQKPGFLGFQGENSVVRSRNTHLLPSTGLLGKFLILTGWLIFPYQTVVLFKLCPQKFMPENISRSLQRPYLL